MIVTYFRIVVIVLLVALSVIACPAKKIAGKGIILATTTSTQDSGLLDVLIPQFEKKTGYMVKTIAVGSGQALAMGERGEADVLLVHSPDAEKIFMGKGLGINRRIVMHNDFIIVGPAEDPANIKEAMSSAEAFKKIAAAQSLFISRGDHSGTHAKEQAIWQASGIDYSGKKWYQETGLGMGQTLGVAGEKKGYTLSDRGTYLSLKKQLGLEILCQGDPVLQNIYHVIEVNPGKWPRVNAVGAKAFADYIVSAEVQKVIGTFGVDKFGSPLFIPDAEKNEGN